MSKIKFDFKNIGLTKEQIENSSKWLNIYNEHINKVVKDKDYTQEEASLVVPFDESILNSVKKLAEKVSTKTLDYIFVIGIGGSNLGTQAIDSAIRTDLFDETDVFTKNIFIDTISPEKINQVEKMFKLGEIKSKEQFLICIISKSGGTTETIVNFEDLYSVISRHIDNFDDRVVSISDKNSKLDIKAKEKGFHVLNIPEKVGGRFSVFTAVGLFPLYLAYGSEAEELLLGAQDVIKENSKMNNNAMVSATAIFEHFKEGLNVNNSFFFEPKLEDVGKWYRQLMGESIGKRYNLDGDEINVGITPIVSIGSTDLHSMAQLYIGGPRDKFTTFVSVKNSIDYNLPDKPILDGLVEDINGKNIGEIFNALYQGVIKIYEKNKLPFIKIEFEELSFYSLGYYLQFKMLEIMYLAKLFNINAFDQPNVEEFKSETRELMKKVR